MRRDIVIRPLTAPDLPAALTIQDEAYPAFLREDPAAFASRLDAARCYCLAATDGDLLIAYLLAHGWMRRAPPAIGQHIPPDAPSDILYIHDLAVSASGRRSGIGNALIARAFAEASRDGLTEAELVAVEGAAPYWSRLGFRPVTDDPALAAKVAAYGAQARFMRRMIAG